MKIMALGNVLNQDSINARIGESKIDMILSTGGVPLSLVEILLLHKRNRPFWGVHGPKDPPSIPEYSDLHFRRAKSLGLWISGMGGVPCEDGKRSNHEFTSFFLKRGLRKMPRPDILVCNTQPDGAHSQTLGHRGFVPLRETIERLEPALVIHASAERTVESEIGNTRIIGVHGSTIIDHDFEGADKDEKVIWPKERIWYHFWNRWGAKF